MIRDLIRHIILLPEAAQKFNQRAVIDFCSGMYRFRFDFWTILFCHSTPATSLFYCIEMPVDTVLGLVLFQPGRHMQFLLYTPRVLVMILFPGGFKHLMLDLPRSLIFGFPCYSNEAN